MDRRRQGPERRLHRRRPDGADRHTLTPPVAADYVGFAQFSPDGTRLLFQMALAGASNADMYTMAVDGTDLVQLTDTLTTTSTSGTGCRSVVRRAAFPWDGPATDPGVDWGVVRRGRRTLAVREVGHASTVQVGLHRRSGGAGAIIVGCGSAGTSSAPSAEAPPAGSIAVSLTEWSVAPATTSAAAGSVTFDVSNDGTQVHEFVVVKTDTAADALTVVDNGSTNRC